jgi:Protein of unknown function (DUF3617)
MPASRWTGLFASLIVAALLSPASGADIVQLPARKAGCWEHTVVQGLFGAPQPDGSSYECVDAASEQRRLQAGAAYSAASCRQSETAVAGASIAWALTCDESAASSKTHFEVSGDVQSAYSMTILTRSAKAGSTGKVSKVVAKAKWISGLCPSALPPGSWLVLGGAACVPDGGQN